MAEGSIVGVEVKGNWRAFVGAFRQRWKSGLQISEILLPLTTALGPAVVIGWVVGKSDNSTAISYAFVGAALSQMWNFAIWRIGYVLSSEQLDGTLELMLTTRTPPLIVMLGKALAILLLQLPTALLVFLVMLVFSRTFPSIDNLGFLVISTFLAAASIVATCFLFAPIVVLQGARAGIFNVFVPTGIVLSGFLYPIDLLPETLQAASRFIPTSWAMDAVMRSVGGHGSASRIYADWAIAFTLIVAFVALSVMLFATVDRRIRFTATLARN